MMRSHRCLKAQSVLPHESMVNDCVRAVKVPFTSIYLTSLVRCLLGPRALQVMDTGP